jgi:hypothetical protein
MNVQAGDMVWYDGKLLEVWRVTVDDGILLEENHWICASDLKLSGTISGAKYIYTGQVTA